MRNGKCFFLMLLALVFCIQTTGTLGIAAQENTQKASPIATNASSPLKIAGSTFDNVVVEEESGKVKAGKDLADVTLGYSTLRHENGNPYMHVPFQGTSFHSSGAYGSGNYDRAFRIAHEEISYQTTKAVVIEADYRLHYVSLTKGTGEEEGKIYCGYDYSGSSSDPTTQIQFQKINALKSTTETETTNINWGNIVTINVKTGRINEVTRLPEAQDIPQDTWTRIKITITLKDGTFTVYTNDVPYGRGKIGTGVGNYTILENTLFLGKCNKQIGQYKTLAKEFVEKEQNGITYLVEKEPTGVDNTEDISYVDIDNVMIRHVEQCRVTLDGVTTLVPENEMVELSRKDPNQTLLFSTVTDGKNTYRTKETSILPIDGMKIHRYVVSDMRTLPQASLRKGTPTGIRFLTTINQQTLNNLVNNTDGYTIRFGTIIAPAYIVELAYDFTKESLSVYANDDVIVGKNYLEVLANPHALFDDPTLTADLKKSESAFAGSVANIKAQNMELDFVGRGFLEIYDDKGELLATIYADYTENAANLKALVQEHLEDPATSSHSKLTQYLSDTIRGDSLQPQ